LTQPIGLLIRADATPEIGAGHVMRCVAVAEAWQRRRLGPVRVWGEVTIGFTVRRLAALGLEIREAPPKWSHPCLLLVDTYHPAERHRLASLPGPRARVLADDAGGVVPPGYHAVWHPSVAGDAGLYPNFGGTVFTGADLMALRADLPDWQPAQPERTGVLLGGGALGTALAAALTQLKANSPGLELNWHRPPVDDPWAELAKCGRALLGAGSIMWEAAAVGIPAVLVLTAENQRRNFDWGRSAGIPSVDAGHGAPDQICRELMQAIPEARPLPRVENGADALVARMSDLAWRNSPAGS
jgi:UDP-2,4-diacetamido-2,4,6-trideoxy-beta-L-altropyranose hydrolase